MPNVFVYGSLKRGFHNNRIFSVSESMYLGDSITHECAFNMYNMGGSYPLAFYRDANAVRIKGEVYEVDDVIMQYLDMLEGHPNVFKRHEVEIDDFGLCWMYLLNPNNTEIIDRLTNCPQIITGEWTSFDCGIKYKPIALET